jgi:SAM-dependent methyltransferase
MECPLGHGVMVKYYEGSYNRCGQSNYQFTLYRCNHCHILATHPVPSNLVYTGSRDENDNFSASDTSSWNSRLLKKVKSYRPSGELLEIGCNSGDFVELASQNGFNSIGVEIDDVAANRGIELGRDVINGDIIEVSLDKQFDVIVLNHVLEHIPDFSQLPSRLFQLLKPDGVVVMNVPNYKGLIARIMKEKWCQMAPFTHVWFYTRESLRLMFCEKFRSIHFSSNTNCEPISFRSFSLKLLVKSLIVKIGNLISMGDELGIVLKK